MGRVSFLSTSLLVCQEQTEHSFKEAMKLEAVNPLSPENIHVATVTKVKGQYVWLSLEGKSGGTQNVVFCRHVVIFCRRSPPFLLKQLHVELFDFKC